MFVSPEDEDMSFKASTECELARYVDKQVEAALLPPRHIGQVTGNHTAHVSALSMSPPNVEFMAGCWRVGVMLESGA